MQIPPLPRSGTVGIIGRGNEKTTWINKKSLAAAVLGWVLCSGAQAEPGITPAEIILGQAAGFTGSVAGTVKELTAGAKAYFDRVNATGGVHGRKIVLESLDDGFDPKRTPEVIKKLIDEKQVFALFLSRGTPTNEAAYPVLEEARVPLVGPSTGAMSMYDPPRRYLFPVRPSYHSETAKIVGQLVSTGINRIAVFHTDDSFGKDGLTGTLNAMKAQGLSPVVVASHARGTVKVEEAVAAIAKPEPQAVIMVTVLDAGVAFIKNLGEDGHGVAVSQVSPYPFYRSMPITQEFHEAIKGRQDVAPSYASMEGFIAAKVMVEGLRRAGPRPTREKLIAALESMQRLDLGGLDVTYGPQNRTGTQYIDLTIINRAGMFVR